MKLIPGKLYKIDPIHKEETVEIFYLVDDFMAGKPLYGRLLPKGTILMFIEQLFVPTTLRGSFHTNIDYTNVFLSPDGKRICTYTFVLDEHPEHFLSEGL